VLARVKIGGLKMGRRDFRRREPKKPKKGSQKPSIPISLQPPSEVEVVPKGKRSKKYEEEE